MLDPTALFALPKHRKPKPFRVMLLARLDGEAWELIRSVDRDSFLWIALVVQTGSLLYPLIECWTTERLAALFHGALGEAFFDVPATATERADELLKVVGLDAVARYNLLKSAAVQKAKRTRRAKKRRPSGP